MSSGRTVEVIAGLPEGVAFPSSPVNGQRFRRTDLKLDCTYYTGIGWLTDQQYERDFQNFGITGVGIQLAIHMADGYDIYIEKFFGENFSTTNNGSNYWTFSLYKESVGAYVATAIAGATLNTSASAGGQVGVLAPVTVNQIVTFSTHGRIGLNFAKTGSPSTANAQLGFTFRKIIP